MVDTERNLTYKDITDGMISIWVTGTFSDFTRERLKDILTGEYDLEEAREDVLSFASETK